MKIVFVNSDGTIHTRGMIAYVHDNDEPEPGPALEDLEAILNFVKDSFAPDYWMIKDGQVRRITKSGQRHP